MAHVGMWGAALFATASLATIVPQTSFMPGEPPDASSPPLVVAAMGPALTTGSLIPTAAAPAPHPVRVAETATPPAATSAPTASPSESSDTLQAPASAGENATAPRRAAQIEPIVEPVKRVQPPAPVNKVKGTESTDGDKSAKKGKEAKAGKDAKKAERKNKVVGDKPNCDAGFKLDAEGKSCVKIAANEPQAKKKRR